VGFEAVGLRGGKLGQPNLPDASWSGLFIDRDISTSWEIEMSLRSES